MEPDEIQSHGSGAESNRRTFVPPGYTTPLEALMEVIRFGPEFLGSTLFLALLYHVERSLCYRKAADRHSFSQMTRGVYRWKGRAWIRGGSGLQKSAVAKANAELELLGLVNRRAHTSPTGGYEATEYDVHWPALRAYFAEKLVGKSKPGLRRMEKPSCSRGGHRASPRDGEPSCAPHEQEQSKSEQAQSEWLRKQSPTPPPSIKRQYIDSNTQTNRETSADESGGGGAAEEFLVRLKQRHQYTRDQAEKLLGTVQGELAQANIHLEEFLAYDMSQTTAPEDLFNPPGYYRSLARRLVTEGWQRPPAAEQIEPEYWPWNGQPSGILVSSSTGTPRKSPDCPVVFRRGHYCCLVVSRRDHPSRRTDRTDRPYVIETLECGNEEVRPPSETRKYETCRTACPNHPIYLTDARVQEKDPEWSEDGVPWQILEYSYPDGRVELRKLHPIG